MRLLGIDYGTKNIGLAIGETNGLALPFGIIENKNWKQVLEDIKKIVKKEEIGTIVIGLPLLKSGSLSKIAREILKFSKFLLEEIKIPVKFQNEQFTSKEVEKLFLDYKKEKKSIKKDAIEAMLTLQSFIDTNI
jgi:putative Holliday junction resolvase